MQKVEELDLAHLPMEDYAFCADPFSYFAQARTKNPWIAKSSFGYVITEYAAMKDLLSLDDKLKVAHEAVIAIMKAEGSAWERWQIESIMAQSGDAHKRVRDAVAPSFTPRAANAHRHLMRQVVSKLLDEWTPKGRFDFEEFSSYFPVTVMCTLIGAPSNELPRLRSSLETLGLSFNLIPDFLPQLEQAIGVMNEFVDRLVANRRAGQRLHDEPDLLDHLIQAVDAGGITENEVKNLLIFLFVAGFDTSKNMLTFIMSHLIDRPEMYARCAEDRAYCTKVTEEAFRYVSPGTISRLTGEDILYRDVLLPKDMMLHFPVSIIGRDPSAFNDPDVFDPDRAQKNRHLAFGRGMHLCLGQFIARAQIEEGLHLIAQRLTNPHRTGESTWRPFPGTWGMRGLPIEFDPAPARQGSE